MSAAAMHVGLRGMYLLDSVLLRTQGIEPPFLDLLNYLPVPSA